MAPHLVRWHREMKDKGLAVIKIDVATELEALREAVAAAEIPHPVVHDPTGENARLFELRAYPAAYLIGRNGKVVWQGVPFRDLRGLEDAIHKHVGV